MRRYTLGLGGREFVIDVNELGADCFQVVVGGETYEVTLTGDENLTEASITPGLAPTAGPAAPPAHGPAPAAAPAAPTAQAAPRTAPVVRASPPAGKGGGEPLKAPMPGVILEINVKLGDSVARGQQVAVLDAMKMHNMVGAPRAGVIAEICVEPGQAVAHGQAIVRIAGA